MPLLSEFHWGNSLPPHAFSNRSELLGTSLGKGIQQIQITGLNLSRACNKWGEISCKYGN